MSARDTPLVTVVVPVYNGARFLAETLASVLAATMDLINTCLDMCAPCASMVVVVGTLRVPTDHEDRLQDGTEIFRSRYLNVRETL